MSVPLIAVLIALGLGEVVSLIWLAYIIGMVGGLTNEVKRPSWRRRVADRLTPKKSALHVPGDYEKFGAEPFGAADESSESH